MRRGKGIRGSYELGVDVSKGAVRRLFFSSRLRLQTSTDDIQQIATFAQ
jgi:hypothetical protein